MAGARSKAARAKREWGEIQEAFSAVREALSHRLFETPITAQNEREKLYCAVQSLDAVRSRIFQVIDAGKVEEAAEEIARAMAPATKAN